MPYSVKEIMKKNDRRWLDLKVCEETNPDLKRSICWDSDPGSGSMVEYTVEGIMSQDLRSCDLKVYSKNYNSSGELLKRIRWLFMKCHYSKVGSIAGKYIPVACGFGKAGSVLRILSTPLYFENSQNILPARSSMRKEMKILREFPKYPPNKELDAKGDEDTTREASGGAS